MPGKIFRKVVLSVIEIVLTRMGRERRGQAEVLEIKWIISKVRNFLSKKNRLQPQQELFGLIWCI